MNMTMKIQSEPLKVDLGERSYDIHIGSNLLPNLDEIIAPIAASRRLAIITDETVHGLYGEAVANALSDYDISFIVRPSGEAQKSMDGLGAVLDAMFEAGLTRRDMVIALGGGVMGDLAGFAASIYKRGIDFIQVPTTLLAQVDSSVGGKTAINCAFGKNLIGAFYQPRMVVADTDVLSSLPARELKAGYAEVLKYGLLGDRDFFDRLEDGLGSDILALAPDALREAVTISCQTKAKIVAQDEREGGVRALLNLGHSFAHIFELAAGYDGDLLHGEAVSAGMEMAAEFSAREGLCPAADVSRLQDHLAALSMPRASDMAPYLSDVDVLMGHIEQDKKNEGKELTLILMREIGDAFVQKGVSPARVREFLELMRTRYVH